MLLRKVHGLHKKWALGCISSSFLPVAVFLSYCSQTIEKLTKLKDKNYLSKAQPNVYSLRKLMYKQ